VILGRSWRFCLVICLPAEKVVTNNYTCISYMMASSEHELASIA